MAENTRGVIRGRLGGVKGVSTWSDYTAAQMPSRPTGPAAPSNVSATGALESIILNWDAPTKDAAGSDLKEGAILHYRVYHSSGAGISISNDATYDGTVRTMTSEYKWPAPEQGGSLGPYHFVVTAFNRDQQESPASPEVSASIVGSYGMSGRTLVGAIFESSNWGTGAGFQLNGPSGTWRLGGSDAPGVFASGSGTFKLGTTMLVFDSSVPDLTVRATYKTATSGKRIEIVGGTGADVNELYAYDDADKKRAGVRAEGVEVWDANGGNTVANRLAFLSSSGSSGAHFYHDYVAAPVLIAGKDSNPGGSWDAYVSGPARLGSGSTVSGSLLVGDHSTGTVAGVVNVIYGTGAAPTASNYAEGTLWVKHG